MAMSSSDAVPGEDLAEVEEVWHSAPDQPAPSHSRCVIHVDIDCFYAQVEMLERPELRERPLGIQQKNIVVTSNYAARARGVGKCCLVSEALRTCPELVLVNGSDLTRYRRMSARIHRVLTRFSRHVERLGFDENFLDVTEVLAARLTSADLAPGHALGDVGSCSCGCAERLRKGAHLAAEVRRVLRDELGISSCAGVGFNKLLAKLAGATHKPDQQTVVFADGVDSLLLGAGAVRALPGIGSRTAALLSELDVRTVADLRQTPPGRLEQLGRAAAAVRALAFGADPTRVKTSSAALSIGVEDGFRRVSTVEECELKLRELARRVLVLLEEDGRVPSVLKVSIRRYNRDDFGRFRESRQTRVASSLFTRKDVEGVEVVDRVVTEAMVLLNKMLKSDSFHLTLLGLAVTGFSERSDLETTGMAKFMQKAAPSSTKRKTDDSAVLDREAARPGGVDPAVWDGLPPDIKSELLRDQQLAPSKKRKQQSIDNFFGGTACSSKACPGVADLPEDPDCEVIHDEPAEASHEEISRSSSCSPVEMPEAEPGSSSDLDDPGSPVVSRSTAVRSEARQQGDSTGSADQSAQAGENDAAGPAPVPDNRDAEAVPADYAPSSPSATASPTVRTGGGCSLASGVKEPLAADVTGRDEPAVLSDRDPSTSPPRAAPADDWDPEVFVQLPPDIQFELKMARRSGRQGQPPPSRGGASPGRPAGGAAKAGSILRFFRK